MDPTATTIDLISMRCQCCHGVLFDADVPLFNGCPHCGGRRLWGSGKTTPEEESYLSKRALENYEKYRDLEIKCIEERLAQGLSPKGTYTGPRPEFGIVLEGKTTVGGFSG